MSPVAMKMSRMAIYKLDVATRAMEELGHAVEDLSLSPFPEPGAPRIIIAGRLGGVAGEIMKMIDRGSRFRGGEEDNEWH